MNRQGRAAASARWQATKGGVEKQLRPGPALAAQIAALVGIAQAQSEIHMQAKPRPFRAGFFLLAIGQSPPQTLRKRNHGIERTSRWATRFITNPQTTDSVVSIASRHLDWPIQRDRYRGARITDSPGRMSLTSAPQMHQPVLQSAVIHR